MRRAAKSDGNRATIVEAARKCGMLVKDIRKPVDLLVFINPHWWPVEIKNPDGKNRYTKDQVDFLATALHYNAPVLTWRTTADVEACANGLAEE